MAGKGEPNMKARRKRLLVLADFLENEVAPKLDGAKFRMSVWGHGKALRRVRGWLGVRTERAPLPDTLEQVSECGFEGCAAGWAYYCPALVRAGIRNAFIKTDDTCLNPDDYSLAEFFGISDHDNYHDDNTDFGKCFAPARSGPTTGVRGIQLVVKRLREVAMKEVIE